MATRKRQVSQLYDFTGGLKLQIREWLRAHDVRQKELASMLNVTESTVSANLRANHTMTEAFVRRLSAAIPEFSRAIYTYFELKSGQPLPAEAQAAMDSGKSRAERIERLRDAEKEVIAAIRSLTEMAINAVEES